MRLVTKLNVAMALHFLCVASTVAQSAGGGVNLSGAADPVTGDKSAFSLFNPAPVQQMREMSSDRPQQTASPYTVDAGHFQVEMSLASYMRDWDTSGGVDTQINQWAIAPADFKVGLLNQVDLETSIETYNRTTISIPAMGISLRHSGFGDVTSRLKINLWGDDSGPTALAIVPFVKFPTSQDPLGNDGLDGGVILPFALKLPAGFGLGLMSQFDFIRNQTGPGRHVEFVNSIVVKHNICGKLDGYAEFFTDLSTQHAAEFIGTVDTGLTYRMSRNLHFDVGVNTGMNFRTDCINPFAGLSCRF